MMTCREVVERLIDFVSDELVPEQRELIEQHLRGCPPCSAYLESYRFIMQLPKRVLRTATLPPCLHEHLQIALREHLTGESRISIEKGESSADPGESKILERRTGESETP